MCVGSRVAAISSALSTAIYEWQTWPSFISVYAEIKLSQRKLAINWQLCNFGQKQSQGLLI